MQGLAEMNFPKKKNETFHIVEPEPQIDQRSYLERRLLDSQLPIFRRNSKDFVPSKKSLRIGRSSQGGSKLTKTDEKHIGFTYDKRKASFDNFKHMRRQLDKAYRVIQ